MLDKVRASRHRDELAVAGNIGLRFVVRSHRAAEAIKAEHPTSPPGAAPLIRDVN
jgi:hypothetical protein